MKTSTVEEQGNVQPQIPPQKPKPPQKATVAAKKGHAAAAKAKSARKPRSAKKGAQPAPKSRQNARPGSKTAKILDLLKRPGGATLKELLKVTSWQPHSIRGFLSLLGKKKGLAVQSTKSPDGERTYSVKA